MQQQLQLQLKIQVLVFPTHQGFVAQCVNFDFAAQGKTVEDVLARFQKSFLCQLVEDLKSNRLPFTAMKPTPTRYQLMFQKAYLSYGPLGLQLPPNMPQMNGQHVATPNLDVKIWGSESWAA